MTTETDTHTEVRTEEDRLPYWPILIVLLTTIVVSIALGFWSHRLLQSTEAELRPSREFPEQNLNLPAEVNDIETTLIIEPRPHSQRPQREALDRYEWLDRERGTVAIPIERAMEILIERNAKERR